MLISPDKCWVELSVNKHHHLKGHGDAEPADAGHHCLPPEHGCRDGGNNFTKQRISNQTRLHLYRAPTRLTVRNKGSDEAGYSSHDVGSGKR